jgi:cardiolipin synthase
MQFTLLDVGSLVLVLHLMGAACAIHAVVYTRTSQGAVAWAVALVTMPYLTLIPYLFLGKSHFAGYVDARRSGNRQLRALAAVPATITDPVTAGHAAQLLGIGTTHAFDRLSGMPLLAGNHVRTLINGTATFDAIFEAIDTAHQYVIVQFFVVRDDRLGQRLKQALLACVSRGVRAYLLYDGIGSHDLSHRYIAELRAAGVETHKFSTRRFVNRFQLNFRNHRKIVVVDGQRAFVGGHNVGNEYLGEKAPLSPWRDTHIEIEGPVVTSIQFVFVEDWFWATQRIPEIVPGGVPHPANMCCQTIASGPADEFETCSLFFVTAINSAQNRIWLTSPYFVPDEAVFTALKLAVMRGVDVRILIPSRRDHLVVFSASTVYANDAVHAGIQMYRYRPGFLHQKVVLIDDIAAAIGSPNLDNRSFRLNFELTVLTVDRGFALEVETMLLADFAQSDPIDPQAFRRSPAWQRAAMRVACLFSPIL